MLKLRIWMGASLAALVFATGCHPQGRTPRAASAGSGSENASAGGYAPPTPVRRAPPLDAFKADTWRMQAMLDALAPVAVPSSLLLGDGDIVLTVTMLEDTPRTRQVLEALKQLGFADRPKEEGVQRLYQRTVALGDRDTWPGLIEARRAAARAQVAAARRRLESVQQPGRLEAPGDPQAAQRWTAGRLAYTGAALDLALPATDGFADYFLPVALEQHQPALGLKASELGFVRGGSAYVGDDGYLRLPAGPFATGLSAVPAGAQAVSLAADGTVTAVDASGAAVGLGRLALVRLNTARGDGSLFAPPEDEAPGARVAPGEGAAPALRSGHLEFPAVDADAEAARLVAALAELRLLNAIELALAQPVRAGGGTVPAVDPGPRKETLALAADMPLAEAHLKLLGTEVEVSPGRTTLTVGSGEKERQQLIQSLARVLDGLRRRMLLAQQNFANALRTRDEQGQLNPYRRKIVKLGEAGEVLEAEDPSSFVKKLMPEHPDAGPDQQVTFPNVSQKVERADFERAQLEYALVRELLSRLDPRTIYPPAPDMRLESAAPKP